MCCIDCCVGCGWCCWKILSWLIGWWLCIVVNFGMLIMVKIWD